MGGILNDYLSQSHKADGRLKDNVVTSNTLAPNSVTNAALANDAVNATISQSGTAGYTMLRINPSETSVGSGSRLLIDAQVGGASKFSVDAAGKVALGSATLPTTGLVRIGDDTTTSAGGLQFGSDTYLFRTSYGGLALSGGLSTGGDLGIGGAFYPGVLTRTTTATIGIHDKCLIMQTRVPAPLLLRCRAPPTLGLS